MVIDPVVLQKEMEKLETIINGFGDKLKISYKAHLILPSHRLLDAAQESYKGKEKIGSTLKGIGPTYTDKISRNGIRTGDIFEENFLEKYNNLKEKHFNQIKSCNFDFSNYFLDNKIVLVLY